MRRDTSRNEFFVVRSVCEAVCHSRRCRFETTSRESVRTIASADTHA
jgi:hypothetical protein